MCAPKVAGPPAEAESMRAVQYASLAPGSLCTRVAGKTSPFGQQPAEIRRHNACLTACPCREVPFADRGRVRERLSVVIAAWHATS